jgi:hypothetical protein
VSQKKFERVIGDFHTGKSPARNIIKDDDLLSGPSMILKLETDTTGQSLSDT